MLSIGQLLEYTITKKREKGELWGKTENCIQIKCRYGIFIKRQLLSKRNALLLFPESKVDLRSSMRTSLKEQVYQSILEDLFQGNIGSGEILNEKNLMEKYQCSKSPVREALMALCADGVLNNIPRYGYEVVQYSKDDIYDMLAFRFILERGVLLECGREMTERDFLELEAINNACNENETNAMTHWKHNTEFHLRLISVCHNGYIVEQLENCMSRLKRAYSQYYWKKEKEILFSMDTEHHVDIVSALRSGELEKAVEFLEEDLQDFGEYSAYRNKLHFSG